MANLRPGSLRGQRIKVGEHTISVRSHLGEGGSAFVYLARDVSSASSASSCHDDFDDSASFDTDCNVSVMSQSVVSKDDVNMAEKKKEKSKLGAFFRNRRLSRRDRNRYVLKATTVGNMDKCRQALMEVDMLQKLGSHPNIVKMIASDFSQAPSFRGNENCRSIHLLLLEFCSGGSLMDLIMERRAKETSNHMQRTKMILNRSKHVSNKDDRDVEESHDGRKEKSKYFDIHTILEIFRQVADVVSFMHNHCDFDDNEGMRSKNKPIVHRDLKPENILLIKRSNSNPNAKLSDEWQVKLCDFGSAYIGRMPLRSKQDRDEAADKIRTTTTQMYRAPEMVDLHMANELTESTDVWALGCCLYMMCFLKNCFPMNENLAILSGKYNIPTNHPYSASVLELIKRMLVMDPKKRATITEVVECTKAIQAGWPLPPNAHEADETIDNNHQTLVAYDPQISFSNSYASSPGGSNHVESNVLSDSDLQHVRHAPSQFQDMYGASNKQKSRHDSNGSPSKSTWKNNASIPEHSSYEQTESLHSSSSSLPSDENSTTSDHVNKMDSSTDIPFDEWQAVEAILRPALSMVSKGIPSIVPTASTDTGSTMSSKERSRHTQKNKTHHINERTVISTSWGQVLTQHPRTVDITTSYSPGEMHWDFCPHDEFDFDLD